MKKKLLGILIFALVLVLALACACQPEQPEQPDNGNKPTVAGTRYVDLYAINDFHGVTSRIATVGSFLKTVSDGNTILLNSGDMFQGSIESNSNYGQLLLDCMEEIGFTSITLGNHEFDWGLDNLRNLVANSSVKFLGANIYNWDQDAKEYGSFADDIADEYVIKTLENGLKVGIIGFIGKSQVTSISSNLIPTIHFKEPADVIPQLSEKLRNEEGCDVIVISAHDGCDDIANDRDMDITQYADAVFGAHTHNKEAFVENGVAFIQGATQGEYVSNIRLAVDKTGKVTAEEPTNYRYDVTSWGRDEAVSKLVEESNAKIAGVATEQLATLEEGMNREAVSRLACKAIANYALSEGYDIDIVVVNSARESLPGGKITYADLYRALPFDNLIYVAEVQGNNLLSQTGHNSIWRVNPEPFTYTGIYKVAVIDYVLFHQNSSRNYNYFFTAFQVGRKPILLAPEGAQMYTYREITKDYLKTLSGTLDVTEFTRENDYTNANKLLEQVSLPLYESAQIVANNIQSANFPIWDLDVTFAPNKYEFAV